jgi:hypothetical protein
MLTSLCGESGLRLSRKWCLETWSQHLQSIEKMGHADQIFPEKTPFRVSPSIAEFGEKKPASIMGSATLHTRHLSNRRVIAG